MEATHTDIIPADKSFFEAGMMCRVSLSPNALRMANLLIKRLKAYKVLY